MKITGRQRKMLSELSKLCNDLGSTLDGTSTNNVKYIDRQRSLMLVHKVIYGVLCDDPENEYRDHDVKSAEKAIDTLNELSKRVYPDRNGLISQFEF